MKINIENLKDSQRLIKIEVEADKVSAILDDVYRDIGKTAHISGFRKGKAPKDLLESRYEETAKDETLKRLAWDCYHQAVKQEGLDPIGYPVIEDVNFSKGMPLTFTVKVDVKPEFKLRAYKGIKIKNESAEVTDEDMDKALKDLQESAAQHKNIEGRPLKKGDYAVCEYECFVEGKSVDKNDKLWLYISDQLQPKELLGALLGAEKDVTKEVEVTHPKDYQHKELAAKKGTYKITVREIKEKILPEINDDLAKGTGRFKSLAELKDALRKNLSDAKIQQKRRSQESQIFENLLKAHPFEVPVSLVERQAERLVEDAKLRLLYQGYKKEDLDKQDEQLKKAVADNARNNVQIFFILDKIARQEKIAAGEGELEAKIAEIAKSTKEDPAEVKKRLEERNLLDSLKEQIEGEKVTEFLLNESKKG
ncbi:MAG: trigger factor [Candidatus Omnitrophica bacterium]|nr:trigger factor [Candidatus Omnitrophota bacterium]